MTFSDDDLLLLDLAIREDIGSGDVTTGYFVAENEQASARIVAKERAVVAGAEVAAEIFRRVDPSLRVEIVQQDGAAVAGGATVLEIRGRARSILTAERVALNFLQRLSGVATLTREFVEAAGPNGAKLLDTRKTTPGMRKFEKAAVVAGGGHNHRFGLHDMVLVKDNHLLARPGLARLTAAIERVRAEQPNLRIEVEADNLDQVRTLLEIKGIEVILLDNMRGAEMREAIALGKGKMKFEASGGINLRNVRQVAATGVDYVSIGALTHSARAIDFSLELTHVAA
ncbi:MAG TPA: carboxylating nicotinate-nucleotide diphosphorylase [Chthoniobacterales bacterium]|nr:carboxylating nicotinate-nucleotide diphosphorylase [Chthoniobacterales bacterium]